MRMAFRAAVKSSFDQRRDVPDLDSQLEELLVEVWRQEDFERKHPFTCGAIRELSRSRPACRPRLS